MRKSKFINHLQSLEEEDLRGELEMLYNKFNDVKSFYAMELGGEKDRKALFSKAEKDIKSKYATRSRRRPKRPRISKIKKILSEISKVSIFKEEMTDLYLFNCECALEFMETYQFHSDPLHNTIVDSFEKACNLILSSLSYDDFRERCANIVDRSFDAYEYLGYRVQEVYTSTISDK